ncbi:hypothetical protein [uncultured Dubosiella sp.]|uniref:hypothetical protein n=1 Tax=uncultured Dubosiella sp. TaxID=1937011 RepID=UPI00260FB764|nr:hypothetical protein [uncultured Dubosiella sp.]
MNLKEYIELNGEREIVDIETLEKCLEPKKPKTIYDIEKDAPYFVLYADGTIVMRFWSNSDVDKKRRLSGYAFLTEEEAEIRKKMLMIEEELIRLGGRRQFKVGKDNYYLNFKFADGYIIHRNTNESMGNEIYFDTQEKIVDAVTQIGTQRLIDEYFKPRIVEENQE